MLVLEGVGQLVGEDRFLLVDVNPVEQEDGLAFGVVVGLDLLLEEGQEKGFEGEVAVQQAELFEHDFALLEALGAFVLLEFLVEVGFDGGAGGDLALDLALDGQAGLLGGKLDEFVDQAEQLLGLLGGDVGFRLGLAGVGGLGLGSG